MTQSPPEIFDKARVRRARNRAGAGFGAFDFLHRRAMEDVIDRLETVKRDFPRAAFAGAGDLTAMLTPACAVGDIVHLDSAAARLPGAGATTLIADEEAGPLIGAGLDLFVSILTLHTANDLVGALAQARLSLKPDGLFIAALFGEETLSSLRKALYAAEAEITGGVAARIAPFASVQDCGRALARAGFSLTVTDIDRARVRYDNPMTLFRDLRGMGETSVLKSRAPALRRDVLARAAELFARSGGEEKFDIVYLTGWAPHESQQKPLKPGSASARLEDAVKAAPKTRRP